MPATFEQLLQGIRNDFLFRPRPTSLPAELRPDWRISVLLLILLKTGRANTASLKKLHVISWAIRNAGDRTTFSDILAGNATADAMMIRFDPALNRALEFALGEKLVAFERLVSGGLNVSLTESGRAAALKLQEYSDCLQHEKVFLDGVGKVSEVKIESILNWEE
jgi:hypothetical protein